ncbi:RNA helicase [Lithospermum erythrorhizon]|uniref:RNA helicase n=1 Tax=Lithospermum erythrorhizon TaxID=34254 RepID=A0AAV3PYW0_LITER
MGISGDKSDDEYSVIGDKGDIGFVDFENCKSHCSYRPHEESLNVVISVPFPIKNGKPHSGSVGDTIVDSITIENTTDDSLELWSVSIYDSKPDQSFTLSLLKPPTADSEEEYANQFLESFSLEDRVLQAGQVLTIWLSCKPKEIGLHTSAVHFTVGDETIERVVFVMADDNVSQSLGPHRPYYRARKKKQPVVHSPNEKLVRSRRPSKGSKAVSRHIVPQYKIPEHIRTLIGNKQIPDAVMDELTEKNYVDFFKSLMFMEEMKWEEDMRDYDMESVSMRSKRQFLTLEIPGLAERRPSIVCGDFVIARLGADRGNAAGYQGYIYRVEAEEVFLKFDEKFHMSHNTNNVYNIQFTYNRVVVRRVYEAIEAAGRLGTELIFPSMSFAKRRLRPSQLVPISSMLNEEQMSAVEMILECKGGSPYMIYGPPGTGKTMTLVEAILQIYSRDRKSRILVCAPSNYAADHLLSKLLMEKAIEIKKHEIFRLNAASRLIEDVNPDYLEYCFVEDSTFRCPSLRDLLRIKIIISTYSSAFLLHAEGIKRGHFSHIFLDEAGQASEPETMVPLAHLYEECTVVVVAGDPMQLGPVVYSKDAENLGLGKSYLERLFKCSPYSEGNESYITKLVRNYRSHPAILHLPSLLFYEDELIPCKEDDALSDMGYREMLPNKEFPLLFIGIQGCDEREGNNPSWFNRIEASKVVEIIKYLKDKGINKDDIGVITPYKQQVLKIRKALESFDSPDIRVGSVEQFQGQEREVIIISTVRSTVKHNEFDKVHYLGFLSNPRRFNVAATRARSLLVVIGNPHIICKDSYWNKLLWYCCDNNSYKGCFLPNREEVFEEEVLQDQYRPQGEENYPCPPDEANWGGDEIDNNAWPCEEREWGQYEREKTDWKPDEHEKKSSDWQSEEPSWGDDGENNPGASDEANWGESSFQAPNIPAPVMDEAEWSDGWKS